MAKQNVKVGVVIPIFDVEEYLHQCVDSVINQSYENLSIMLVCDDDKVCLDISLEYARKDSRIIVVDKENGGLSRNRNVGIDFYSNKYEFIESNLQDSIKTYKVTNDNPYNIRCIYVNNGGGGGDTAHLKSHNTLEIPQIDYIIFLDSDDYWENNLVEKCLAAFEDSKSKNVNVDFVWFDYSTLYDGVKDMGQWSRQKSLGFYDTQIISSKDFLQNFLNVKVNEFAFAWAGLIDFQFVKDKNISFLSGAVHQDVLFGILLILKSDYIYILAEKLLVYRTRPHSASNFEGDNNINTRTIHPFIRHLYVKLHKNARITRAYYKASSWYYMYVEALHFINGYEKSKDSNKQEKAKLAKEIFLPHLATKAVELIYYPQDPLNIIPHLQEMQPFLNKDNLDKLQKFAIYHYKFYRICYPLLRVDSDIGILFPTLYKILKPIKSLLKLPYRLTNSIIKRIKKLKKFL